MSHEHPEAFPRVVVTGDAKRRQEQNVLDALITQALARAPVSDPFDPEWDRYFAFLAARRRVS